MQMPIWINAQYCVTREVFSSFNSAYQPKKMSLNSTVSKLSVMGEKIQFLLKETNSYGNLIDTQIDIGDKPKAAQNSQ